MQSICVPYVDRIYFAIYVLITRATGHALAGRRCNYMYGGDPVYNGGGVVQLLYTWVYSSHVDIAEIFELRSNSSD